MYMWWDLSSLFLPLLPPSPPPPSPSSSHQPENLLLASKEPGASVKLADFGLAVEAMDGKHYYGTTKDNSVAKLCLVVRWFNVQTSGLVLV